MQIQSNHQLTEQLLKINFDKKADMSFFLVLFSSYLLPLREALLVSQAIMVHLGLSLYPSPLLSRWLSLIADDISTGCRIGCRVA